MWGNGSRVRTAEGNWERGVHLGRGAQPGPGPAHSSARPPFLRRPPTGCCRTGWAAALPRAARRPSTGPALRRGSPGLPRTGHPPPPWSWHLRRPRFRWPSHQGRWRGTLEPAPHRRPGAAAGPRPKGRPRPAEPLEPPAGPPAAPAAALEGGAAAGGPSRSGRRSPAEGKRGGWGRQAPGRGAGAEAAVQVGG